jgi:hypothetical protein
VFAEEQVLEVRFCLYSYVVSSLFSVTVYSYIFWIIFTFFIIIWLLSLSNLAHPLILPKIQLPVLEFYSHFLSFLTKLLAFKYYYYGRQFLSVLNVVLHYLLRLTINCIILQADRRPSQYLFVL